MADIAEVGLIANSSSVRDATRDLDAFNRKGGETEKETKSVNRVLDNMVKNFLNIVRRLRLVAAVVGGLSAAFLTLRTQIMAASSAAAGAFVDVKLDPFRDRLRSVSTAAVGVQDNIEALTGIASEAGVMFLSVGEGMSVLNARMIAAGHSISDTRDTISGYTRNLAGLGTAQDDINSKLSDVAELAGQASVSMDDLLSTVDYTNDPLNTLSQAFGITEDRVQQLIDANAELSGQSLVVLGEYLGSTAQESQGLTAEFSRLVNIGTELFNKFNQSGVISALTTQLERLGKYLQSDQVAAFMQRMSEAAVTLISETLPNLAKSFIQNWDTIVTATASATGFLIGTAVGGLPGGVLGAIIGGSKQTRQALAGFADVTMTKLGALQGQLSQNAESVSNWSTILIRAAALIADVFSNGFQVVGMAIKTVGEYIGGLAAIVNRFVNRDFQGAINVGQEFWSDQKQMWGDLANNGDMLAYSNRVNQILSQQSKTPAAPGSASNAAVGPSDSQLVTQGNEAWNNAQSNASRPQRHVPDFSRLITGYGNLTQAQQKESEAIRRKNELLEDSFRIGQRIQQQLNDRVRGTLDDLRTPQQKARERYDAQVDDLQSARNGGLINQQQHIQKLSLAWDQYQQSAQTATESASIFSRRGAENIQDTLGDTLQQTLSGNFDGILSSWIGTVQEMAAQAASANLSKALLGNFGETGKMGGLLGDIGGSIVGGLFGGGASAFGATSGAAGTGQALADSGIGGNSFGVKGLAGFASGGISDKPAIFGEAGPEAAVPLPDGRRIPVDMRGQSGSQSKGPVNINMTYNEAPGKEPQERHQDQDSFFDQARAMIQGEMEKFMGDSVADGSFDKFMSPYSADRQGHI